MGARKLAEAIILQGLDDLSDSRYRYESIDFFTGEGFEVCAGMAGLDIEEKLRIMSLVKSLTGQSQRQTRVLSSFAQGFNHAIVP